jgi:type-F conjugative transfer system pilin assembly protein TrbC
MQTEMKLILKGWITFSLLVSVITADASPSADLQKMMRAPSTSRKSEISAYVFVSTTMNDGQLINLARQARNHGFSMVLNGFGENDWNRRIASINAACCGQAGPPWIIHPQLFKTFQITEVPAFVISKGESGAADTFSKVTGAMAIPDALGIFANRSKLPFIRMAAHRKYHSTAP